MGGNLFKAGRVSKSEYFDIVDSLKPTLDKFFGEYYRIPVAYREKADYGDVDVIVDAAIVLNKRTWKEDLKKELGVEETKSVRNVYSLLYRNFQVDFFLVGSKRLDSTYNFMSYNILGNLIGRIYHKFNLRYGEDGLFYVLRGFNNHVSKEVSVTRDMNKMLTFIGLSYERWLQGFDNVEEIFEYVISSKYFCTNSYDRGFYNVQKRMTERPDFNKFLDYLENNKIEKNYSFQKNKEIYLDEIDEFFETDLKTVYSNHLERQIKLEKISKKFNGYVVMSLLGIKDKELGVFIGAYKNGFESEEKFEDFILTATQNEIEQDILLHATK